MAIADIPKILSDYDCGYHASGTIRRQNREIIAYYFTCDRISSEALEAIHKHWKHCRIENTSPQYAPEIRKPCLVATSPAELKRQHSQTMLCREYDKHLTQRIREQRK